MDWNHANIDKLRQLWAMSLSTAEIGRRMGVSKNAVVGKAHRLNLPGRPSPIQRTGHVVTKRVRKPRVVGKRKSLPVLASVVTALAEAPSPAPKNEMPQPVSTDQNAAPSVAEQRRRSEMGLDTPMKIATSPRPKTPTSAPRPVLAFSRGCCWPLWGDNERPTHVYCDAAAERVYCPKHNAMAHIKTPARTHDAEFRVAI